MKRNKKLKNFSIYNDLHIKGKILILFILLGLLPMLIVSFIQLRMMTDHLQTYALNESSLKTERMAKEFNEKIYRYNAIVNSVANNRTLSEYLVREYDNLGDAIDLYYYIYDTSASIKKMNENIELFVYTTNSDLINTKNPNIKLIENINEAISPNEDITDLITPKLNLESIDLDEYYVNNLNHIEYVSINQVILEPHSYTRPIGVVRLLFDIEEIDKLFQSDNDYTTVILIDNDDNIVYTNNSHYTDRFEYSTLDEYSKEIEGDNSLYYYNKAEKEYYIIKNIWNDLKIVTILHSEALNSPIKDIQRIVILIISLTGVLAIVLVIVLSSITGKRFDKLLAKINIDENQMPESGEPILGNDEIGIIDKYFRRMTVKLKAAVNNSYKAQQEMHQAQLLALQNQINPHFLYNVLSDIGWMTQTHSTEEIRDAINMVVAYYRSVHSGGRDCITLDEEIKCLQAYADIQELRTKGRMKAKIIILHQYTDILIPKMSLQPIVENSFEYGIGEGKEEVNVIVTSYLEGEHVVIEISDNGIGIDEETIQKILSDSSSGYGIKNVRSRLSLYFEDLFEFYMENMPEGGTKTIIKIPLIQ